MGVFSANDVWYTAAKVLDLDAAFCDERIDPDTLPDGVYKYEIRCSDYDDSVPAAISDFVAVNYFGTVLLKEELDFTMEFDDEIAFNDPEEDFYFLSDIPEMTLADFLDSNGFDGAC